MRRLKSFLPLEDPAWGHRLLELSYTPRLISQPFCSRLAEKYFDWRGNPSVRWFGEPIRISLPDARLFRYQYLVVTTLPPGTSPGAIVCQQVILILGYVESTGS